MPDADDSHANVVRQLRAGRNVEENFRRLFEQYYPAVSGYFARHGFTADESRDMAQDVFVAVYEGLEKLRNEEAFVAWLFSIARYTRFRYMERRQRSPQAVAAGPSGENGGDEETNVSETVAAAGRDPLVRLLEIERVEAVREALNELPERVRECLRARLAEDLNYREIGERLGISENTVAVHVHRGLKTLKARIRKLFGEAPFRGDV